MELISSTRIRRDFKHEVYMKTKKSMELSKWQDAVGKIITINFVFKGKRIPGRSVSPWVLESILKIIKEKRPDSKIFVISPDWPKICAKYATITKKPPKEGSIINVGVLRYGAEKIVEGSPNFIVLDATVCWSKGPKICDSIICSNSKEAMASVIKRFYGSEKSINYKIIGELPKIVIKKETFWDKLFIKRQSKKILKHPLYSQEFS